MDFYAPKKKGERIPFDKREYLPGKWHKEDKKKISKGESKEKNKAINVVPSLIEIQKKLDKALKKLQK